MPGGQRRARIMSAARVSWLAGPPDRAFDEQRQIEKSTLKKPHYKSVALAASEPFTLYTLRHPQEETVVAAMDRAREARGSHSGEKSSPKVSGDAEGKSFGLKGMRWSGREDSNLRPPGPEPGALPG